MSKCFCHFNGYEVKDAAARRELETLVPRVNNLTTLEGPVTTGDAELIDARVGADGVTYDNLGDAIRTQFTNVKSDLGNLEQMESKNYEGTISGYIASNGAIKTQSAKLELTTENIPVSTGDIVSIDVSYSDATNAWAAYGLFDKDGVFIDRFYLANGVASASVKLTIDDSVGFICVSYGTLSLDSVSITKEVPIVHFINELNANMANDNDSWEV